MIYRKSPAIEPGSIVIRWRGQAGVVIFFPVISPDNRACLKKITRPDTGKPGRFWAAHVSGFGIRTHGLFLSPGLPVGEIQLDSSAIFSAIQDFRSFRSDSKSFLSLWLAFDPALSMGPFIRDRLRHNLVIAERTGPNPG